MAQMTKRGLTVAGNAPPIAFCEIYPIPGTPVPLGLNSFTGSSPITIGLATVLATGEKRCGNAGFLVESQRSWLFIGRFDGKLPAPLHGLCFDMRRLEER